VLTAAPFGVLTAIFPEPLINGTLVEMLVALAELTTAWVILNFVLFFEAVVSKLVPLTVTLVPEAPIVGVKLLIVGALEAETVKEVLLETEPAEVVTLIGPVVAPVGTVVTICVAVAEATVAVTPLNVTVFWLGVVLNAVP
jgi:hypothetical protein